MTALEVAAALAVFAGAGLQSAVGFGFSLVCAPLVFAAHGPLQAIGLLTVLGLEVNLVSLLGEGRRPAPVGRLVAVVLACSVPGMVAGVAVLRSVDAVALQVAVTVTVLASLAVQHASRDETSPRPQARGWAPAAGLAAGVLTTTTSTAGPPLVLLLLGRRLAPMRVRDTLTVCFIGLSALGGAVLAATGTRGALPDPVSLAAMVPLAALGQLAGRPVFARLAAGHYEAALTAVLLVSATVGLLTAVA